MSQPIRVLVAKPGLDGHDRGALVIAQGLRDEGMEVIYTGLRQTPIEIVTTALQEDVACIGLSSLSGAHMEMFPAVVQLLRQQQAEDILVIGGGVIPEQDVEALTAAGIAKVFTPGTRIEEVAQFIRDHAHLQELAQENLPPLALGVDHIGIAVTRVDEILPFYTGLLGLSVTHQEVIADQEVKTTFLTVGGMEIELLEPLSTDGPVAKFLFKHGPGIHHMAFAVADVNAALRTAQAAGFRLIDERARPGGRGKEIAFLHPKDTSGVLIELCQRTDTEEDIGGS
ncbi:methylmalonyl-CoA epimerase [Alicyclobacillaceae bacterium I2511]|nr:methylmalonyl-CoA epimerase [Alicyclobacillaceae bacterium I2511]